MTREFLKQLGIEDKTVIDSIMDENGRDINSEKAKFGDYETLKTQLSDANKKIEEFGKLDFDGEYKHVGDVLYETNKDDSIAYTHYIPSYDATRLYFGDWFYEDGTPAITDGITDI